MSSNLVKSAELMKAPWFVDLVRAALIERALLVTTANPTDHLSKAMIRDPAFMLPIFVAVVADHPVMSSTEWKWDGGDAQQDDIRGAVLDVWGRLVVAMGGPIA